MTRAVSGRGSPYAYDRDVPIIFFYGASIGHGAQPEGSRTVDVAPTHWLGSGNPAARPHRTDIPRHSRNTEGGGSGSTRKCIEFQTFNLPLLRDLEIEMIMVSTSGVELSPAERAAIVTLEILDDRELRAARTAQYGLLVPLARRPSLNRVIG